MNKSYLYTTAKGRGGPRPVSNYQMRAIRALAQCEGMDVARMRVRGKKVICSLLLHGIQRQLRLDYSDTFYLSHAKARAAIQEMGREMAHEAALLEDEERTASRERAKEFLVGAAFAHFDANTDYGQADPYTADIIAGAVYSAIEEIVEERMCSGFDDIGDIVSEACERTDEYVDEVLAQMDCE